MRKWELGMRKAKKQLCVRLEVGGLRQKAKSPSNLINLINYFLQVTNMRDPKDYIIFPLDVATFDEAKRYVELLGTEKFFDSPYF